jgi:Ubiquitin-specific protease C-terminal
MQAVRVYEAQSGKIHKELRPDFSITGLNEYVSLYAEKIPEEELNMQGDEHLITAFNFDREPGKSHGIPFKFVVKPVSAVDTQFEDNNAMYLITQFAGRGIQRDKRTTHETDWHQRQTI